MKRKRVVFFDAYPHEVAGAQRATLLLMTGLVEHGWDVTLAVPADGPFVAAAGALGIDAETLHFPRALRVYGRRTTGWRAAVALLALPWSWVRTARWLRARADIVHVADHRGQLLVGPAAWLARRPVVWHVHGIDTNRVLNAFGAALARQVVTPSRAAADRMRGLERRRPATIVPYALSDDLMQDANRRPPASPVVVTLTRLHPDKGLDNLLRAVALLVDDVPGLRVVIAGGTQAGHEAYEVALHELRAALDLDAVVEFAGRIAAPRDLLLGATVYVQPARERTEIQPLAILEAMACGVPVVATQVGGVAEMLADGQYGTLVPPDDPAALAGALLDVIRRPDVAQARADAGQSNVRATRTAKRFVAQVEDVYASL